MEGTQAFNLGNVSSILTTPTMKYTLKSTFKNFDNAKRWLEPYIFSDAPYIFRKKLLPNGKVRIYTYDIGITKYKQPNYFVWYGDKWLKHLESLHGRKF